MNDLETKYQFEAIWPSIKNGAILRSGLSKNVGSKMKVFIRDRSISRNTLGKND